jgi:aminopeptidase-like protein
VNQKPHGAPFLKRHPEFGTSRRDIQQAMIWLLNQSDGRRSLFSIANLASIDIDIVRKAAAILTRAGLITRVE